jgi:xanthine/uracil/vitamin C permease (AzgA family)
MSHSESTSTSTSTVTTSAAAKLFDIRLLIGALFTFYGVALGIYGFFTSQAELDKAAGININLWLGIGMLVLGLLFLLWRRLDPVVHVEPNPTDAPRHPGGH